MLEDMAADREFSKPGLRHALKYGDMSRIEQGY